MYNIIYTLHTPITRCSMSSKTFNSVCIFYYQHATITDNTAIHLKSKIFNNLINLSHYRLSVAISIMTVS